MDFLFNFIKIPIITHPKNILVPISTISHIIYTKYDKVNSTKQYYELFSEKRYERNDFVYFPRLRDLREDNDLTQTEVANLLFTSQTVYSRYERGALTIPVEHLIMLADFYKVSTDYILGRTDKK